MKRIKDLFKKEDGIPTIPPSDATPVSVVPMQDPASAPMFAPTPVQAQAPLPVPAPTPVPQPAPVEPVPAEPNVEGQPATEQPVAAEQPVKLTEEQKQAVLEDHELRMRKIEFNLRLA